MSELKSSVKAIVNNVEWSTKVLGRRQHLVKAREEQKRALAIDYVSKNKEIVGQTDAKNLAHYSHLFQIPNERSPVGHRSVSRDSKKNTGRL